MDKRFQYKLVSSLSNEIYPRELLTKILLECIQDNIWETIDRINSYAYNSSFRLIAQQRHRNACIRIVEAQGKGFEPYRVPYFVVLECIKFYLINNMIKVAKEYD